MLHSNNNDNFTDSDDSSDSDDKIVDKKSSYKAKQRLTVETNVTNQAAHKIISNEFTDSDISSDSDDKIEQSSTVGKNITNILDNKIVSLFRQIFIDDIICEILLYSDDCELLNEFIDAYPQILQRIELPKCDLDECKIHPPLSDLLEKYFDSLESTRILNNQIKQLKNGNTIRINNKKYRLNEIGLLIDENNKKISFDFSIQPGKCHCNMLFIHHNCFAWTGDNCGSSLFSTDLFLKKECLRDLVLLLHARESYIYDTYDKLIIYDELDNFVCNKSDELDELYETDMSEIIDLIKEYRSESAEDGFPAEIKKIKCSSTSCTIYVECKYSGDDFDECCYYDINIHITFDDLAKEEITKVGSYYGEQKDYANMEKYYNMAIAKGCTKAMEQMALYYGEINDYVNMERYCKMIINKNGNKSIDILLEHYKNGC